jgi:hypothetical protein
VRELNEGPGVCDEGMDVDEFLTWAAYFMIEPPVEQRADVHVAMLMAQQYNMNRGKGKAVKKPADFMPRWIKRPPAKSRRSLSPEQLKGVAQRQFLALGGDPNELKL